MSRRARATERDFELATVLQELSAATIDATVSLAMADRDELLAPAVATDRAMLHALGHDPPGHDGFDVLRPVLIDVLQAQPRRARLPWHGGPMTVRWALQQRVAATWALLDRLAEQSGTPRPAPLLPIVELALELLPHSFLRAGRAVPETTVAVELTAPDGSIWQLAGPQPADWPPTRNRVTGPALDCCRLACGRTRRDATALHADGEVADTWLDVIDALAYGEPP